MFVYGLKKKKGESHLSFFVLLVIFLTLLLVGPLLPEYHENIFFNVTFSFFVLTSIFTIKLDRSFFIAALLIALSVVVLNSLMLYQSSFWIEFLGDIAAIFLIGCTILLLFKHVFFAEEIGLDLVFGSMCVYLLLGVLWALFYSLVDLLVVDAFRGLAEGGEVLAYSAKLRPFFYYSFVTQTTLGYGDVVPLASIARNLAIIQALIGQFYIAVLVAGLVAALVRNKS